MNSSIIATRMEKIRPSPTLSIAQKARELKAQGKDVISLNAGEPDFDTPNNIKEAANIALAQGKTKYTTVSGTDELKEAIIKKYQRDNNLEFSKDEIIVSNGGKHVLFNALLATVNPGDEVILPAPFWVSYPEMINFADGKTIIIDCKMENEFKLSTTQLEQAITPKTKWLILNHPNNPTGIVYSVEELRAFADVLLRHPHVHIMTDDIYEHMVYDGIISANLLTVEPRLHNRILLTNGVSKAYSMTGWRIGYAAGQVAIIKAMSKLQSQSTSNPCSIAQAAAVEALNGPQNFIAQHNATFERRRNLIYKLLNEIPGIECMKPHGAFYVFPSIKGLIGKTTPKGYVLKDDQDFSNYLLDEALVSVIPGFAFGNAEHIRISYATSDQLLEEAAHRIKIACFQLK